MKKITPPGDLPNGLSQPALRAIALAGITDLKKLAAFTENEFKDLHGVGPKAVTLLRAALKEQGLDFKKG